MKYNRDDLMWSSFAMSIFMSMFLMWLAYSIMKLGYNNYIPVNMFFGKKAYYCMTSSYMNMPLVCLSILAFMNAITTWMSDSQDQDTLDDWVKEFNAQGKWIFRWIISFFKLIFLCSMTVSGVFITGIHNHPDFFLVCVYGWFILLFFFTALVSIFWKNVTVLYEMMFLVFFYFFMLLSLYALYSFFMYIPWGMYGAGPSFPAQAWCFSWIAKLTTMIMFLKFMEVVFSYNKNLLVVPVEVYMMKLKLAMKLEYTADFMQMWVCLAEWYSSLWTLMLVVISFQIILFWLGMCSTPGMTEFVWGIGLFMILSMGELIFLSDNKEMMGMYLNFSGWFITEGLAYFPYINQTFKDLPMAWLHWAASGPKYGIPTMTYATLWAFLLIYFGNEFLIHYAEYGNQKKLKLRFLQFSPVALALLGSYLMLNLAWLVGMFY